MTLTDYGTTSGVLQLTACVPELEATGKCPSSLLSC